MPEGGQAVVSRARDITSLANYSPPNGSSIFRVTDGEDWTDRHVARWRDHWIDVAFEDDVEAIVVRIGRLKQLLQADDPAGPGRGRAPGLRVRHPAPPDDPGHPRPREPVGAGRRPRHQQRRHDRAPGRAGEGRAGSSAAPTPTTGAASASRSPRAAPRSGAGRWTCAAGPRTRSCTRSTPEERATLAALLKKMTLATEDL